MLKDIKSPDSLRDLTIPQLKQLSREMRAELIKTVSKNGGHLASNLGVVELTIAMHYVYDCPNDKFVFDVGHQCYAHKLLTGRYERFRTLRKKDGISGFPSADESEFDTFVAGHASTAISAALGMARTRDIMHADNNVVAVVGDGALTGGMCYEALNDAGKSGTRLVVILNDNEMSISKNVGALSGYLNDLRQLKSYRAVKRGIRRTIEKIPKIGNRMFRFVERIKNMIKSLFIDGQFFEALGFTYIGPIDGHDIKHLIRILNRAKDDNKPVLIHVITQKGKGYEPAESHPDRFHGVAPFLIKTGKKLNNNTTKANGEIIAHQLSDIAENDIRISVISAAMVSGTGMTEFSERHPERFFDVGIAEEHAVTMAAGMAAEGMKPYIVLYSTFMQRAYDQLMIDVCRNKLPVTVLLDHAGLVGSDGATHQGVFDLSYLRSIPNLIIASPRDTRELKKMIDLSVNVTMPLVIRYTKSSNDLGTGIASTAPIKVGEWELLSDGADIMFFAVGQMVQIAMQCSIELIGKNLSAGVVDARFIKPLDKRMLIEKAESVKMIVTLEENTLSGGFGEAVAACLANNGIIKRVVNIGVPDNFISHASEEQQRELCGLTVEKVCERVNTEFSKER